jgi:hypothetical protein
MQTHFRKYFSVATSLATIAFLIAFVIPAAAQNGRDWDHGRDARAYQGNSQAYQSGFQDGVRDAQRRGSPHPDPKQWKDSADRQSYSSGYQAGYQQGTAAMQQQNGPYGPYGPNGRNDRDRDRNRGYGNGGYGNGGYGNGGYGNGGYGNGGYGVSSMARVAQQSGYTDGAFYAQRDMQRGNRFDPTGAKGYKDADHNYSSSLGSKNEFKQIYRQAFIQGYRNAYRTPYGR